MTFKERLYPRLRAGEDLVSHKPVFSSDSKFLLVPSGTLVKVFSCSSGECVRTYRGHKSEVVSVTRNPANLVQILSCSKDGIVLKWDVLDGSTVKRHELQSEEAKAEEWSILEFYAPQSIPSWFVLRSRPGKESGRLEDAGIDGSRRKTLVDEVGTKGSSTVAFGSTHDLYAAIHKSILTVSAYSASKLVNRYRARSYRKGAVFTCVACHPDEPVLATGDTNGCITIWQDVKGEAPPSRAIYHWHTLPVADLVFSATGSNLWSGGGECVLVKWYLGDGSGGKGSRQFLPRMGLPICQLASSPDNSYVVSAHSDNCLQLVNVSQHHVARVVQSMTRPQHRACKDAPPASRDDVGLLHDPHTGALVLKGRPGHLQFHLPLQDKQLYNLDVVGQNYLSQERRGGGPVNTEVCRAAICTEWLATVEHWQDSPAGPELRLKFWRFDPSANNFILNTNVYLPHYKRVNDLQFRITPGMEPLAVSTGQDKKFRLWMLLEEDNIAEAGKKTKKSLSWNCTQSGSFRETECGRAAFCQDGSLLALTFGRLVTLWALADHDDRHPPATLCGTLGYPDCKKEITAVSFGRNSSAHMLVSCSPIRITVWNIVTLSVHWSLDWLTSCLASDPASEIMAAFSTDGSVLLFEPKSGGDAPLYRGPVAEQESGSAVAAIFVPDGRRKNSSSRLYYLTEQQALYSLEEEGEDEMEELLAEGAGSAAKLETNALSATPFGALVAEESRSAVAAASTEASRHSRLGVLGFKEIRQVLDMYSHTLPPLSSICQDFMSSFLTQKRTKTEVAETDDENEEDDDSDSDMDVDKSVPATSSAVHTEDDREITSPGTAEDTGISLATLEDFAWITALP